MQCLNEGELVSVCVQCINFSPWVEYVLMCGVADSYGVHILHCYQYQLVSVLYMYIYK